MARISSQSDIFIYNVTTTLRLLYVSIGYKREIKELEEICSLYLKYVNDRTKLIGDLSEYSFLMFGSL